MNRNIEMIFNILDREERVQFVYVQVTVEVAAGQTIDDTIKEVDI